MELLINSYDDALIYFPNIFFLVIGVTGILSFVFAVKYAFLLIRKSKTIIGRIKIDIRRLAKIKPQKKYKINFAGKLMYLLELVLKITVKFMVTIFSSLNNFFKYLEKQIFKLFRTIGKEIFID